MIITLIGYRGSGKSTVVVPLAQRLGWEWIDADAEIERRAGRSIREIFSADGEPAFRELERQVMADLLQRDRLVVAAGGGAVLNAQTRSEMQAAGPVVWLKASVDTLYRRIGEDASTAGRRPDLTSTGGRREIEDLLARREPLYFDCATLVLDTDGRTPGELVEAILQAVDPAVDGEHRRGPL